MIAKLSDKNQLTLPQPAVDALGPVTYVQVEIEGNRIVLTPEPDDLDVIRQEVADLGLTDADVDEAVAWARKKS